MITLATPTPTLLRPGAVTKEMLEAEIGPIAVAPAVLEKMADGETAASPGMKYKHYAPKAQVILVNGDSAAYAAFVNSQPGCYACAMKKTGDGAQGALRQSHRRPKPGTRAV